MRKALQFPRPANPGAAPAHGAISAITMIMNHQFPFHRRGLTVRFSPAIAVLCAAVCLFPWGIPAANAQDETNVAAAADVNDSREDETGPTIKLNYTRETFEHNPISSFMYFVPLISRTPVDRQTSADNEQEVGIVSYDEKVGRSSFVVTCTFEIRGTGFHKNTFDPAAMIADHDSSVARNQPLESVLDYVNFEGEGLGEIEVRGTIDGASRTVTNVDLRFNVGGKTSPVTIGLYDLAPVDGKYEYDNRTNQIVARVNTLSFTRTDAEPTMGIKVATIRKPGGGEGFFARIKGVIANLGITPPKIEPLGNETMMRLGLALVNQDPEFTFPVAKNLEKDQVVEP